MRQRCLILLCSCLFHIIYRDSFAFPSWARLRLRPLMSALLHQRDEVKVGQGVRALLQCFVSWKSSRPTAVVPRKWNKAWSLNFKSLTQYFINSRVSTLVRHYITLYPHPPIPWLLKTFSVSAANATVATPSLTNGMHEQAWYFWLVEWQWQGWWIFENACNAQFIAWQDTPNSIIHSLQYQTPTTACLPPSFIIIDVCP